jgi:urease beta subunit
MLPFLLAGGCFRTAQIAADNYDRPMMVGPVRNLAGVRTAGQSVGKFDVQVENYYHMMENSYQRTEEWNREAANKVDVAAMEATRTDPTYRIYVEEIPVCSYVFSFVGAFMYLNSWARVEGQVVRLKPIEPPPPPVVAPAPVAAVEEKPAAPPEPKKKARRKHSK